ncbi:MAG: hypothetical protein IH822_06350 [Chloroflexi bacterium]|nr:hypothetical protein [Chloroflexota bacterium]
MPEPGVPVLVGTMSCPRCRGWLFRDPDGLACLQCGYVRYPEAPPVYTGPESRIGHRGKSKRSVVRLG